MDKKQLGIHFGALADPIEKQLEAQGFIASKKIIEEYNRLNHARLQLLFGGCITDSENEKIMKKIMGKLKRNVKIL